MVEGNKHTYTHTHTHTHTHTNHTSKSANSLQIQKQPVELLYRESCSKFLQYTVLESPFNKVAT